MELGVVGPMGYWIGEIDDRRWRSRSVQLDYIASLNLKRRLFLAF